MNKLGKLHGQPVIQKFMECGFTDLTNAIWSKCESPLASTHLFGLVPFVNFPKPVNSGWRTLVGLLSNPATKTFFAVDPHAYATWMGSLWSLSEISEHQSQQLRGSGDGALTTQMHKYVRFNDVEIIGCAHPDRVAQKFVGPQGSFSRWWEKKTIACMHRLVLIASIEQVTAQITVPCSHSPSPVFPFYNFKLKSTFGYRRLHYTDWVLKIGFTLLAFVRSVPGALWAVGYSNFSVTWLAVTGSIEDRFTDLVDRGQFSASTLGCPSLTVCPTVYFSTRIVASRIYSLFPDLRECVRFRFKQPTELFSRRSGRWVWSYHRKRFISRQCMHWQCHLEWWWHVSVRNAKLSDQNPRKANNLSFDQHKLSNLLNYIRRNPYATPI